MLQAAPTKDFTHAKGITGYNQLLNQQNGKKCNYNTKLLKQYNNDTDKFQLRTIIISLFETKRFSQYIRDFYNEDPESYSGEIHKLEALRATAMRPVLDSSGCSVLKKYYCQLHFLQSRFPMGKDGAAAVNFTW